MWRLSRPHTETFAETLLRHKDHEVGLIIRYPIAVQPASGHFEPECQLCNEFPLIHQDLSSVVRGKSSIREIRRWKSSSNRMNVVSVPSMICRYQRWLPSITNGSFEMRIGVFSHFTGMFRALVSLIA